MPRRTSDVHGKPKRGSGRGKSINLGTIINSFCIDLVSCESRIQKVESEIEIIGELKARIIDLESKLRSIGITLGSHDARMCINESKLSELQKTTQCKEGSIKWSTSTPVSTARTAKRRQKDLGSLIVGILKGMYLNCLRLKTALTR